MRIEPLRPSGHDTIDEAPLGRDAGQDSARNVAAFAIVGLACVAVIAVGVSCYAWNGHEPVWSFHDAPDMGGFAPQGVAVDQPMLRPSLSAGDPRITVYDAATGRSETLGGDELDTADAAHVTGVVPSTEPASLTR